MMKASASKRIASSLLVVALAAPAIVSANEIPWPVDRIKSEWTGKKLFVRAANGGMLDMWLRADGTAQITGNNFSDSGQWRLSDNGYCAKWTRIRNGEERCFTVVDRSAGPTVLNLDGSLSGTVLRVIAE